MDRIRQESGIRVVQLQYRFKSSGDFANRFHKEFEKIGVRSKLLTLIVDGDQPAYVEDAGRKARLKAKVDTYLQAQMTSSCDPGDGKYSFPILGTNVHKHPYVKQADVIILHWILNGFLNLQSLDHLFRLAKPVIVVMHDMWFMTGGCHYSFECKGYQNSCGQCPIFTKSRLRSLPRISFRKKKKLLNKYENIYFVSPSRWMASNARSSSLLGHKPIRHIPNPLDRSLYKSWDVGSARKLLGIEKNRIVLAFGAVDVDSPYKGWKYMQAALDELARSVHEKQLKILVFGNHNARLASAIKSHDVLFMGKICEEYSMSLIYNAADVFVAPSLADNLPYTIFESLACGTPVVAFNTGGIPEMIRHGANGYLARLGDSSDLAEGILYTLSSGLKGFLPAELNNDLSMESYLKLFEEITGIKHHSSQRSKTKSRSPIIMH